MTEQHSILNGLGQCAAASTCGLHKQDLELCSKAATCCFIINYRSFMGVWVVRYLKIDFDPEIQNTIAQKNMLKIRRVVMVGKQLELMVQ